MSDPVWVSSEEIVAVSSSPDSDSNTLHRWGEELDNLMVEVALDLGEGIPVTDARSHVSSSDPLLQEVEEFSMVRSREEDDLFWEPPGESMTSSELKALRQNWSIPDEVLLWPLGKGVKFWDMPSNFTLVYEYQLRCGLMFHQDLKITCGRLDHQDFKNGLKLQEALVQRNARLKMLKSLSWRSKNSIGIQI